MSLLLKLLIVYIFFAFIFIGLCLSKIKLNVKEVKIQNLNKNMDILYRFNIGLYLYGTIKILGINFNEKELSFLGKKIPYKTIKESKWYKNFKRTQLKELESDFNFKQIRDLKIKTEKLDMEINIGFENVLLTSFMIFAVSTVLSFIVKDTVKKYNEKKYKYIIMPYYQMGNIIKLKANGIFAIKTVHIMFILLKYKKRRVKNYERTSYRRSYENSYE